MTMAEADKAGKGGNTGRYIIETRMDEFFKELNIDKNRITHEFLAWNLKMTATTALLCSFSIAPYIYLNQGTNNLKKPTWVFPVLRATGGFITATLIQLLIQRRITTLSDQYLKRDQVPIQMIPRRPLSLPTRYLIHWQMISRRPSSLPTRRNFKWKQMLT